MRAFQTSALRLTALALIAASCALVKGQDPSARIQPASIAVSIAMKQSAIPSGQKVWLTLSEKNIDTKVNYESNDFKYRIQVEGSNGEPPRTYYHRQLRGEPGVPSLRGGGAVPLEGKAPGESAIKNFDLTVYYDLSVPGKYSVYLDVRDASGTWLRTNTLQFEVQPSSQ